MKIYSPDNIFTRLILKFFPAELKENIIYLPSALITKELIKSDASIGFIPTMDIITNKDLYISKNIGVSFEGSLGNSYIYYKQGIENISDIHLYGDISSTEVIAAKILFKEIYGIDPGFHIVTKEKEIESSNVIIIGDKNFETQKFVKGISFTEEIIDMLSLPFVNFVLASKEEELIKLINDSSKEIGIKVYDFVEKNKIENLSADSDNYLKENISSFIVNFDSNDIEGINQLLRLPYFHGIIESIVDVNYV